MSTTTVPQLLARAPATCDPAHGLLRAEHFQIAYVTTDIEAACALFSERLGITSFARLGGPMPAGGQIEARFAWVGTVMYEIIAAEGPGSEVFRAPLAGTVPRDDGFRMAHHHFGYLVHTDAQWLGLLAEARRQGWAIPSQSRNPLLQACFVEVPELGHYLEYLYPEQAGLDFFASVPRH